MTEICIVDERDGCCSKPKKQMKLVLENDRVKLQTSNGYVMLSIQLNENTIFFRTLEGLKDAEQTAVYDLADTWKIKDRC